MGISDFGAVVERLDVALASGDLPGHAAQVLMAARPQRTDRETDLTKVPADCRHAGVLVLLYPQRKGADDPSDGAGTNLALTLRTEGLGTHGREVSFPGGALEAYETPTQAALREAREEVSLELASVDVLGGLTPLHIPISRFVAHPVVAVTHEPPQLTPDPAEVAAIMEAHLHDLMAPGSTEWAWADRPRGRLQIPFFPVSGVRVWGATAMILAELLAILGWKGPSDPAAH